MMNRRRLGVGVLTGILLFFQFSANASFMKEKSGIIHVAKTGSDANNGNERAPFLTITKAEAMARPGDRIIVHKGTYREMIVLHLGGTSQSSRITFMAAAGEDVIIKGSEQIKSWVKECSHTWKTEIADSVFKGFNPFIERINKDSSYVHLGNVYLNDKPLKEKMDFGEVDHSEGSWFTRQENGRTIIMANFGQSDPNIELTEVNVRPAAFVAIKTGISYIEINGFKISRIASPMASINGEQPGAIAVNGGTYWFIQNCTLNDCKSVAISIGQTGHSYPDASPRDPEYRDLSQNISGVGHHIIKHNHIFRCGQAGVFGLLHGTCSEITDNLIEDINSNDDFPSGETAGIRLALAVDVTINHNLIRRVNGASGGYGIFLGPLFQGARITRNVISDTRQSCICFYNSHGPALIDNNILSGPGKGMHEGIKMISSEANVFVQNLFYNCGFSNTRAPGKSFATSNFLPHSLVVKQTIPALPMDDKWYSNLFIKGGLDQLSVNAGCEADYNVYMDSASVCTWGDKQRKVIAGSTDFKMVYTSSGMNLTFNHLLIPKIACPALSPSFVGFFTLSKQYIEYPDGKAITINKDFWDTDSNKSTRFPGPFYKYPKSKGEGQVLFNY
jgi:alpha-L-arabinofuranosidase